MKLTDEAQELILFADNDANLYHRSLKPIVANLRKKVARGTYDPIAARKLWGYHAERAAKAYAKEFASPSEWSRIFPPSARREAATYWESEYRRMPEDDGGLGLVQHSQTRRRSRRR